MFQGTPGSPGPTGPTGRNGKRVKISHVTDKMYRINELYLFFNSDSNCRKLFDTNTSTQKPRQHKKFNKLSNENKVHWALQVNKYHKPSWLFTVSSIFILLYILVRELEKIYFLFIYFLFLQILADTSMCNYNVKKVNKNW